MDGGDVGEMGGDELEEEVEEVGGADSDVGLGETVKAEPSTARGSRHHGGHGLVGFLAD